MGALAFGEERDRNGDESVAVRGDEAVEKGTTEALNGGSGAGEPGFGDAEDFTIAAFGWRRWRERKGLKKREL